jgi:hypothetical protein
MKTLQLNLIINLLFLPSSFQAQTYGNEWIDYSQTYYHFNIFNNGIYQLDYATLDSAGVPLNTFQSENIQIFGKERELPIHIEDGGDNSIDPGDYILFYAERNDGWLDSTIYIDSSTIGNPAYSLYNDTLTLATTAQLQTLLPVKKKSTPPKNTMMERKMVMHQSHSILQERAGEVQSKTELEEATQQPSTFQHLFHMWGMARHLYTLQDYLFLHLMPLTEETIILKKALERFT